MSLQEKEFPPLECPTLAPLANTLLSMAAAGTSKYRPTDAENWRGPKRLHFLNHSHYPGL